VKTPVWFAADPSASLDSSDAKLYVYTIASPESETHPQQPRVKIAPCDMRGRVLGEWVEARVAILTGEELQRGNAICSTRRFPWKQMLDFFAMFRRRERTVFAIRPA